MSNTEQVLHKTTDQGLKVEIGITSLIREQPVFGFILTRMRRCQAAHICPTMGVRPTADKQIQLSYNPAFVEKLTDAELKAVLEHEVMHILNEHMMRRQGREHTAWNIAADMAINQYLKGLPEGCIELMKGLEGLREAEYYYSSEQVQNMAKAFNDAEKKGEGGFCPNDGTGNGNGTNRGDHSGWDEMDGEVEMQSQIRELIKGAVEDAKRQGRGTMPGWMEEMIERLMKTPIRWQNLLRRAISEEVSATPEETFRKPHRHRTFEANGRQQDIFPGFKRAPLSKLTCAVDTSGSVDSDSLAAMLNELAHLSRTYGDIELIHCDAEITCIEKYTGKNKIVMHGRGGTAFTPVLEHMRKKKTQPGAKKVLVYFTDGLGDCPKDDGYTKKFDTIWVITKGGSTEHVAEFGTIIKMEDHKRKA